MKVCCVCGARPNFMKVAAVVEAMAHHPRLRPVVLHTGQHYDHALSKVMFDDLGLPRPDVDLGVGAGTHAWQTAEIMKRFEPAVLELEPDLVLVVGDVNSTVACSLVATKLGIKVAHVEAGLRSFDRSMPEEINRLVTDALSDLLFVSESSGVDNLRREGVADEKVFFVGNVMIDTLLRHRERASASDVLERLGVAPRGYAVLTLHRPSNVDDEATLRGLVDLLSGLARDLPVVFPAHPRTVQRLKSFDLDREVARHGGLRVIEPLGYLDFVKLMGSARAILTDSGGIQEEATILRVPCLTLRENTERPATLAAGWNTLVGTDPARVGAAWRRALDGATGGEAPEGWDGRAGERIVEVLSRLPVGPSPPVSMPAR
jgi:UDP-N-acetylglucosamine 2-epimerase (non-hydrolysing)